MNLDGLAEMINVYLDAQEEFGMSEDEVTDQAEVLVKFINYWKRQWPDDNSDDELAY